MADQTSRRKVTHSKQPDGTYLITRGRDPLGTVTKNGADYEFRPRPDSPMGLRAQTARTMEGLKNLIELNYNGTRKADIERILELDERRKAGEKNVPTYCPPDIMAMKPCWYEILERA